MPVSLFIIEWTGLAEIAMLQNDMFGVLDELIGPLSSHITQLLSQPVTGTDDQVTHVDTKKAYLTLLNSIMASKLHGIFISERKYPMTSALITLFTL